MNCPNCNTNMNQIMYEGVEIDICGGCSGVWLDSGELTSIVKTKEKTWPIEVVKKMLDSTGEKGISRHEANREILCPKCNSDLPPANYQYNSGIIVNTCPKNHGVWLDSEEIDKIQIYMEKWDEVAEENSAKYDSILNQIEKEQKERISNLEGQGPTSFETINRFLSKIAELV